MFKYPYTIVDFFMYTLIFLLISGWSFLFGFNMAKDYGLEMCKKSGWEFIEDKVFPKAAVNTHIFGPEYGQQQLNHLQANIATKCIGNFYE